MKFSNIYKTIFLLAVFIFISNFSLVQTAHAGSLTPPSGAPANTMYTLNDLYTLVTTGTTTPSSNFTTPTEATSTMRTITEIVNAFVPPPDINASGPFVNLGGSLGYNDTNTSFVWQAGDGGYRCWSDGYCPGDGDGRALEATEYCQNLSADGVTVAGSPQNVWRLPTVRELQSIVDYSLFGPVTTLPNTQSDGYWSSTTYAGYSARAWVVYMYDGYVDNAYGANGYGLVRCVH